MNKEIQHLITPAYPTFPIQDQFQRVMMSTGISKIELFTLNIAATMAANHSEKYLPETIAEEAYAVALATFEKLQEELQKLSIPEKNLILDEKGGDSKL